MLSCLTLTVYFAHHAMYGRFGLENNRHLTARARVLAEERAALEAERARYTRDIALLSGAPHPDVIEEAARRILGYADPRARIVTLTK
ncbi:MAG: septum formation initiator family protein [Alphaproteobacteria bacterium]|nr:septum formation initiator family protein [Alphaproteobacteria bacterium]